MAFFLYKSSGITTMPKACINLSDPAINGHYYSHWRGSLALNLSTLTGKLNGEGASVVVFPDGLKRVNDIRDVAAGTSASRLVAMVPLWLLDWGPLSSPANHVFRVYSSSLPEEIKPPVNDLSLANAFIIGYTQKAWLPISAADNMCFAIASGLANRFIMINHACSTVAEFVAACTGLYICYELATPLTYTLDTPLPTDLTCEQGDILQRVSDNNCPFVGEMKFGL